MHAPSAGNTGSREPSQLRPVAGRRGLGTLVALGVVGAFAIAVWVMLSVDGSLSHRSVAESSDKVTIGHDIECVRIEVQNGTVGVDVGSERAVAYSVGVGRAANTAQELAEIEQIPFQLVVVSDPARPRTLILRGPFLPAGNSGLLRLELGIRIPAELALEIDVVANGHVTVGHRVGKTFAKTGRGDLRFEHCLGPVKAESGRGMVIAFDHEGDLDIHTHVGDMQAFVRRPGRVLRLVTGQGTVQCGVPENLEFDLDARAEVGRIGAGFDLTGETIGDYGAALVAKRGAASTRVVLRTGSGHIAFKPKKFE